MFTCFKKILIRLSLTCITSVSSFAYATSLYATTATEGVLDLSKHALNETESIELRGDWSFYWQQLLTPSEIVTTSSEAGLMKVPSSWNRVSDYTEYSYATYHLEVRLSEIQELGVSFEAVWSASKIWIDGELVAEVGVVHTEDAPPYKPNLKRVTHFFTPKSTNFDIVVQAANFDIFLAGLSQVPKIGTPNAILRDRQKSTAWSLFLVGTLIIMAIYHLALFLLRTKERSTLHFATACLVIALYLLMTSSGVLADVFNYHPNYDIFLRLYNLWMLLIPPTALFVQELFPKRFHRSVSWFVITVTSCLLLTILFLEPRRFVPLSIISQLCLAGINIYSIYVGVRAFRDKTEGAGIFLFGITLALLGATHDMLNAIGIIQSQPIGAVSFLCFIFCQSYLLARKFSNAFSNVERSEREIRQLSQSLAEERDRVMIMNENLEEMVEEKTRDLKSIMNHIQLGIFTIDDDSFAINADYSDFMTDLFEQDQLMNQNAFEVMFNNSSLSNNDISQAASAIACSIGEDDFIFETNAHCLPNEYRHKRSDNKERILEINWNPITNSSSQIDKILVTIRDVTELKHLELEARDKREELDFIAELINIDAESFRRFVLNCKEFMKENTKLLQSSSIKERDLEILKVLFINMHTMKGAARSLYLKRMTDVFHNTEQYYAALQKNPNTKWDLAKMRRDLKEVQKTIEIYETIATNKLGRKIDGEEEIVFSHSQVESFYDNVKQISQQAYLTLPKADVEPIEECKLFIFPILYRSAHDVFEDICSSLPTLAKDLGKANPKIIYDVDGYFLNHAGEDLIRKTFIHILRNSMDHGIETPEERLKFQKSIEGQISIEIRRVGERYFLNYHDDGRGLNLNRIMEVARSQGIIETNATPELNLACDLIFHSGLSTASKVSEVSGRGVGMDAVRSYLNKHGASISIHLLDRQENLAGGYSFFFEIELPKDVFANHPLSDNVAA